MKMNSSKDSAAGFSLLELIVVIAIITLLAGILTPLVKSSLDDAKTAKTVSMVDAVKKAATKYWYDTDKFATTNELVKDGQSLGAKWKGPYLDSPLSAASNPYAGGAVTLLAKTTGYGTGGVGTGGGGFADLGGVTNNNAAATDDGGQLVILGVPIDHAKALDRALDGTASGSEDGAKGTVEYDTTANVTSSDVYIFLFKK